MSLAENSELTAALFAAQTTNRLSDFSVPVNDDEQRDLFLSDRIENPHFIHQALIDADPSKKLTRIAEYRRLLGSTALPIHEQGIHDTFAQSLDAEVLLFTIAQEHAVATAANSTTNATTRRFLAHRDASYGELPRERYQNMVRYVLDKFKDVQDVESQIHLSFVDVHIGHSIAKAGTSFLTPESIERVSTALQTLGIAPDDAVPDQPLITNIELAASMNRYLADHLDAEDWLATRTRIQAPAQTDRINNLVKVNDQLPPQARIAANEMVTHEGVHALRAMLARAIGSTMLLSGLPGSDGAEEGLATIAGKVSVNNVASLEKFDYPIFVAGLMEEEGYDFRTTFEVFWRVLALFRTTSSNPSHQENITQASREQAYQILTSETRIFDRPRFSSLENMNGVVAMWRYLDEHADDPMALETILIGKHDPSNDEHRQFVYNSL